MSDFRVVSRPEAPPAATSGYRVVSRQEFNPRGERSLTPQEIEQQNAALRADQNRETLARTGYEPGTSQGLGFHTGFTQPAANIDRYIDAALQFFGGRGTGGMGRYENRQSHLAGLEQAGVERGMAGEIAGGIAGTAPTLLMGPLAAGASQGALLSEGESALDVGRDVGLGAAFSKVGDMAFRGLFGAGARNIDDNVRTLVDADVPLTPGQILGGRAKSFEDALTSNVLVGRPITQAQNRSLEGFNRAVVNDALQPLGATVPGSVVDGGRNAVTYGKEAVESAYDAIVPNLTISNVPGLVRGLEAAKNTSGYRLLGSAEREAVNNTISEVRLIAGRNAVNGTITGDAVKTIESIISAAQNGAPVGAKSVIGDMRMNFRSVLSQQNPTYAAALQSTNDSFGRMRTPLRASRSAATNANPGVFTPRQYAGAVRGTDRSIRGEATATGSARGQSIADAGMEVLPQNFGNSGTADRLIANGVLMGAPLLPAYGMSESGGGVLSPQVGIPLMIATGGASGAYSKSFGPIMRYLLSGSRNESARRIAEFLSTASRPAIAGGVSAITVGNQGSQ